MATKANITPARALETAQFDLSSVSHAVRDAYRDMLESLAFHVRVEEYFAGNKPRDRASSIDPAESVRACEAVGAAARKLRQLPSVLPGDKALTMAALLVELAVDMEEAADRERLHQVIARARACLLLEKDDAGAVMTNPLLNATFSWLERLAALEWGEAQPPSPDGPEAMPDPVFCR